MVSSHVGVRVGFQVAPRIFVSGALGAKDRVNHHAVPAGFQSVDSSGFFMQSFHGISCADVLLNTEEVAAQDGMKRQGITHILNLIGNEIYDAPWMG
jgi:hypothetical protein